MRAMQIIEWGKPLEARDYPTPEPVGEQVLVRVESAGVCHSDVHIWDGYFDLGGGQKVTLGQRGVTLPFTMGHEIAGEVVARGPEAKGVEIGKRYAVYPWIGCGTCAVCQRGDELLCLTPRTLGTRTSGGYGTDVVVPQARYLVDYGTVPQALAATYTCSGITAFSALKKIRDHVDVGDYYLIIGAGGVGGQAVHIAPAYLGGQMLVADIDAAKRAHAQEMGRRHHRQQRGRRPAAGAAPLGRRGGWSHRLRRLAENHGVRDRRPAQGRQAGDGGPLRRRGLRLHGAVPVQDDVDRGLLRRQTSRFDGAAGAGPGRQDPPIPIEARSADRATESLADLKSGGKSAGAW